MLGRIYNYTVTKSTCILPGPRKPRRRSDRGVEVSAEELVAAMLDRTSIACATLSWSMPTQIRSACCDLLSAGSCEAVTRVLTIHVHVVQWRPTNKRHMHVLAGPPTCMYSSFRASCKIQTVEREP